MQLIICDEGRVVGKPSIVEFMAKAAFLMLCNFDVINLHYDPSKLTTIVVFAGCERDK